MRSEKKNILEFTLFYNRYKTKIYNYVLRMVNDRMLCEDIVQNVFLKLYENIMVIRNKDSVQFWLFRTARNDVYAFYRGKKTKVDQFYVSDSNEVEISSNLDLQESLELKDVKEHVMNHLSEMSFDQREVFILKEYGGFTYKEIASLMDIDENLVKSRLFKTRKKLINELEKIVV